VVVAGAADTFLVFDMDGVIVDSNPFHQEAWRAFCRMHGCALADDELRRYVYGRTNADALRHLFGDCLDAGMIERYASQKEQCYRELFRPHLEPLPGLLTFLGKARGCFAGLAVATSAPPENVDFVLDTLNLRRFFPVIVDETLVSRGKPDPEIYLKTAALLGAKPSACIVFEDSPSGIRSAKDAGMAVVGVSTTHAKEELAGKTDWVADDFSELAEDFSILFPVMAY
jgi:beta-phosphoglucomutase